MARFSRRQSGRPARRRNLAWSGTVFTRTAVAAGAQSNITICDSAAQLAVGLTPVLQRIRGSLGIDPDINPAETAPQFWTTYAAIWVGAPGTTAPDLSDGDGWASEAILWGSLVGLESRNVEIITGTDSELLTMYNARHEIWTIDVRAKRRLEDPQSRVFLSVRAASSNTSDIQYSGHMRCLHAV